jgi:hypothetical protein
MLKSASLKPLHFAPESTGCQNIRRLRIQIGLKGAKHPTDFLKVAEVGNGIIVDKAMYLIKPPTREFVFTYIHGLTWKHVAKQENFGSLWPKIESKLYLTRMRVHRSFWKRVRHCLQTEGLRWKNPSVAHFQNTEGSKHGAAEWLKQQYPPAPLAGSRPQ